MNTFEFPVVAITSALSITIVRYVLCRLEKYMINKEFLFYLRLIKRLMILELETTSPYSRAWLLRPASLELFLELSFYRVSLLKKFDSEGCCVLVFGLLRSPKASMQPSGRAQITFR